MSMKTVKKNSPIFKLERSSAIVLLLFGMCCLVFGTEEKKTMKPQKKMNFYGRELPVFKCGLHTHSTVSDGSFTPAEVIRKYARAGYDVLAFTDHRKPNPVSTYDGLGMTLISGMEIHPRGPRNLTWHLLALGIPEDFPGKYRTGCGRCGGQSRRHHLLCPSLLEHLHFAGYFRIEGADRH